MVRLILVIGAYGKQERPQYANILNSIRKSGVRFKETNFCFWRWDTELCGPGDQDYINNYQIEDYHLSKESRTR